MPGSAAAAPRRHVLLLANQPGIPTQVLLSLKAAGHRVSVLGGRWAAYLGSSRHVERFTEIDFEALATARDDAETARRIDAAATQAGCDIVVAGDDTTTRLLCLAGPHMATARFPMPPPELYFRLGHKQSFDRALREAGLPAPATLCVDSKRELTVARVAETIGFPAIVKPAVGGDGVGVRVVEDEAALKALVADLSYEYGQLVAQSFIAGEDVDCSVLAEYGRVRAVAVQVREDALVRFIDAPDLVALCTRLVEATGYHGVAHIDARRETGSGRIVLIECNPRLWASCHAATTCGLNFVGLGLAPVRPGPPRVLARGRFVPARRLVQTFLQGRLSPRGAVANLAVVLEKLRDPRRAAAERQIIADWHAWHDAKLAEQVASRAPQSPVATETS